MSTISKWCLVILAISFTSLTLADSLVSGDTIAETVNVDIPEPDEILRPNLDIEASEQDIQPLKPESSPSWNFYFLMALSLGFALMRIRYGKELALLMQALVNFNLANQTFRQQYSNKPLSNLFLNAFFVFSISFYVYCISGPLDKSLSDLNWFVLGLWITIGVFIARFYSMKFFASLFGHRSQVDFFLYNMLLYFKLAGIILVPILFGLVYGNDRLQELSAWVGLIIIGAAVLLTYFRGIQILGQSISRIQIHFFIYLCSLEIGPWLIVIKILNGNLALKQGLLI